MVSLHEQIKEYRLQLGKGHIQKAYQGIMAFMSSLNSDLEKAYPGYFTSSLYFGYMDMTYFAFTPPQFKDRRLKIAIVYLHEEGRFEAWLGANNRKIQTKTNTFLKNKAIGNYHLIELAPGVDAIISSVLVEKPNFTDLDTLKKQIEENVITFIHDMTGLLAEY